MLLEGDLRQILRDKPDSVVWVVGTGVPKGALRGTPSEPYTSWEGLLRSGLQRSHELAKITAAQLATYESLLRLDFDSWLLVAEKITQALGGGEFRRWLRETVGTFEQNLGDRTVLDALADHQRRGCLLATTNYDYLLEEVTRLRPATWLKPADVELALRGDEPHILHLHGAWREAESIVLGIRSYDEVVRSEHARAVLTTLRTCRTFVFVGCGAGLRDPNIGTFLKWTATPYAGSEHRHFRLCRRSEVDDLKDEHPDGQRIFPLPYGDDHADLAPFLRSLLPAPGVGAGADTVAGVVGGLIVGGSSTTEPASPRGPGSARGAGRTIQGRCLNGDRLGLVAGSPANAPKQTDIDAITHSRILEAIAAVEDELNEAGTLGTTITAVAVAEEAGVPPEQVQSVFTELVNAKVARGPIHGDDILLNDTFKKWRKRRTTIKGSDDEKRLEELRKGAIAVQAERDKFAEQHQRSRDKFVACTGRFLADLKRLASKAQLTWQQSPHEVDVQDTVTKDRFKMPGAISVTHPNGRRLEIHPDDKLVMLMMPRGYAGLKLYVRGGRPTQPREIAYDHIEDHLIFSRDQVVNPILVLEMLTS